MPPRHRRPISLVSLILALAACAPGPGSSQTGAPSASRSADRPSADTPTPAASTAITQTDTEWGRIWDALPPGFPRYPGAAPADDASTAPSSGRYVISGGDPQEIAAWLQAAMETAQFSTDVSGPLEDGGFTLDSVGVAGCRIQTTVAPQGGMTLVTILYATDCPIG